MSSDSYFRVRSLSLLDILAAAAFIAGIAWRIVYVIYEHDPRKFVYSDMMGYVTVAKKIVEYPDSLGAYDIVVPPGTAFILSLFYRLDPSLLLAVLGNLFFSILIPMVAAVGATLWFGRRAGKLALIASSLYFPFIDYAGYFLSELYNIFFFSLFLMCFAATALVKNIRFSAASAIATGFFFSVLICFKLYWYPAIGLFLLTYTLFYTASPLRLRCATVALILAGFLPVFTYMSFKCTQLNDGQYCPGSRTGASDFLMGHYGRGGLFVWNDKPRGALLAFGSPGAAQRGLSERFEFDFSLMNTKENVKAAWGWIRNNPFQAFVQSLEHVNDAFFSTYPWPSVGTAQWKLNMFYHYVFLIFLFFPAVFAVYDAARGNGWIGFFGTREFLAATPLLGLIAALLLATGEARYRIPFDVAIVLLASRFYSSKMQITDSSAPPAGAVR